MDERPGREELIEALRHACIAAQRVRDTAHYDRAHAHIDRLLDELVDCELDQGPAEPRPQGTRADPKA